MEIEELNKSGLIHFTSFLKYKNENNKSSFYPFTSLNNITLFNKLDDFYIYEYNLKSKNFLPKVLKDVTIVHEFYNEVSPDLLSNNTRLSKIKKKTELGIIFIDMYFNYIIKYQKVIIYINGNDEELSSLFFFLNRYNSNLHTGISRLVSLLKKYDFNDGENISNYLIYINQDWNDHMKIISLKKRYTDLIEYNNYIKQNIINKTYIINLEKKIKRLKYNNNDIKYQKDLFISNFHSSLRLLENKINLIGEECKKLDKIDKKLSCILLPMYLFSIIVFIIIIFIVTIIIKEHFIYTEL